MPPADARPVTPALLRGWPLPEADEGGAKAERGAVLVVGGAESTPGAVLLAGLAALRVGAGKLKVATVRTTAVALGVSLPEARVVGLADHLPADDVAGLAERAQAVVVGPGLLDVDAAGVLLEGLLPRLGDGTAVVVDALALTALGRQPELLAPVAGRAVLTPNGKEASALLDGEELPGPEAAAAVAARYGCAVATHGGAAAPDGRVWADEAGGIGLGTSGSGDVLAGCVGGLLARGAPPAQAAVFGQYAHGAAGDRLAARAGRVGFLARELLDDLAPVLAALRT